MPFCKLKLLLILPIALQIQLAIGQTFLVDTIFVNGNLQDQINIVFLSDGYQQMEMDKYITDVNSMLSSLFDQVPFKNYKNYFNAFAIRVPSQESGAMHPQNSADPDCLGVPKVSTINNYFGSTFDYAGIHRLLAITKPGAAASILANQLPQYDLVFVLVNSPYYGGAGGDIATSSTHNSASEISIHEIGHTFAFLADEYWAGSSYAAERPNLTQESNSSTIKWKSWLNVNGIGIYPHAESPTWYRPHQSCKMRLLGNPFCSVCTENFVERIHSLTKPIISFEPKTINLDLENTDLQFKLFTLKPSPNTLKIEWKKANTVIGKNIESVTVPVSDFNSKITSITATVIDTTSFTRNFNHLTTHLYSVQWIVKADNIVTEVFSSLYEFQVTVFPNPIKYQLTFNLEIPISGNVSVILTDVSGKVKKTLVNKRLNAGLHSYEFPASDVIPVPGIYFLNFNLNGNLITQRIIRE
ncbi:MAG: T9SS C-terminal target domain-containing protein [Cytophagia bacterium]|nr:T9SS C-terminal target domain-containing protein [Cytophagia bacterium]